MYRQFKKIHDQYTTSLFTEEITVVSSPPETSEILELGTGDNMSSEWQNQVLLPLSSTLTCELAFLIKAVSSRWDVANMQDTSSYQQITQRAVGRFYGRVRSYTIPSNDIVICIVVYVMERMRSTVTQCCRMESWRPTGNEVYFQGPSSSSPLSSTTSKE